MASRMLPLFLCACCALGLSSGDGSSSLILPKEVHFRTLRQLTFGGQNAEGYFSTDETKLIFQSTRDSLQCDQEFVMDLASGSVRMISTGRGRTTCGYFFPGDTLVLFSSTHHLMSNCPPRPDFSKGYTWAVTPEYDIFTARPDGSNLHRMTTTPGYDAEATISPRGDRIVFTSMRNGDLDLYTMNLVYRACHYEDSASASVYRQLLSQNLVRPLHMEIFVMNADGSHRRQITFNGAANFAPFFHPDNRRIIFASNVADPQGRDFDLYLINIDGSGLERVTYNETFDGFPMFTHDGRKLVFASNRNGKVPHETNLFIADWKE